MGEVPAFHDLRADDLRTVVDEVLSRGGGWVTTDEARRLLAAAGISSAATRAVATADEAVAAAEQMGYPVVLKATGPALLDHFPSQLSGGEPQRVAVARAIAQRPDVLLCDEPTGALDITTGITVLEAIERASHELGATTAIITHNTSIAGMADRVLSMADGRVTAIRHNATKVAARELPW